MIKMTDVKVAEDQPSGVGSRAFKELISMMYWSMLAACTVGPGTVVTCARAGAEQGLQLVWALVFATCMAYTLQVRRKCTGQHINCSARLIFG